MIVIIKKDDFCHELQNVKTYFWPMFFYFKALHIIGFVSWFAGLFYLVRLFVYHVEAEQKPQPEQNILKKQFNLMEWKLYSIITNPAMIFTVIFGLIVFQLPSKPFFILFFICIYWVVAGYMLALTEKENESQEDDK